MDLKDHAVLVTGADGFIGSHLVEALLARGCRVRALAQYNSFNSWGWLESLDRLSEVEVVTGDIRDSQFCRSLIRDVGVVFHLAALIPIPYSYVAPDSYVDTNIKGTLNICNAARDNGVRKIVHTSTSEVYGTAQYVPINESHPLKPQSPYSATKIGADCIALSFYYSFELPVVVARPFNTYGPRQSARAVIPTIIAQIASGMKKVRLGDVSTTRDFTYVADTCQGFLQIAEHDGGLGEVFHIGSGTEVSVGDLFRLIARIMNSDAEVERDEQRIRPQDSEVFRLCCDNKKLLLASGFQPQIPLEEGLRRTIEWFRCPQNLNRYKGQIYNV
jgi:NAD dependent epimerase/dehydratase